MVMVRIREGESAESGIRRFKRECEKAGRSKDLRKHEAFEKPSSIRKRAKAAARKRLAKRLMRETLVMQKRGEKVRRVGDRSA